MFSYRCTYLVFASLWIHASCFANFKSSCDVCIIGGGMSGLSSAVQLPYDTKTILVEAQSKLGGRVSSESIDGFTLNRGFAVFIDEYPESKAIFDYDELQLAPFQPGALIKRKGEGLARIADPLRQPTRLIDAIISPVGTVFDKIRLVPLLLHVRSNTISQLFDDEETDVYACLKSKYGFSDKMIQEFFQPFFEGIFFCPLKEQSSHMFHFVFKMFSEGRATLPTGGMQAVANQLCERASNKGIEVRLESPVSRLEKGDDGMYKIILKDGGEIEAKSIICATEGTTARQLLSTLPELKVLSKLEDQAERSVGCMYYKLAGDAPVKEAILILNGERCIDGSINNVCFPSIVNPSYAPEGYHLCSVAIDSRMMTKYEGREEVLDQVVRQALGEWFPEYKDDIQSEWELLQTYRIHHAQPAQLFGPMPANVNGGRPCNMYRDISLPDGLFISGDYMNTASLNGALESGKLAAIATSKFLQLIS